eukprot:9487930-Pyramimonas_sp.AAC.1
MRGRSKRRQFGAATWGDRAQDKGPARDGECQVVNAARPPPPHTHKAFPDIPRGRRCGVSP